MYVYPSRFKTSPFARWLHPIMASFYVKGHLDCGFGVHLGHFEIPKYTYTQIHVYVRCIQNTPTDKFVLTWKCLSAAQLYFNRFWSKIIYLHPREKIYKHVCNLIHLHITFMYVSSWKSLEDNYFRTHVLRHVWGISGYMHVVVCVFFNKHHLCTPLRGASGVMHCVDIT